MFILTAFILLALSSFSDALPNRHRPYHGRVQCPIIFDGRIRSNSSVTDFDNPSLSPYSTKYVKGENLTWSSIIEFPSFNSHRSNLPSLSPAPPILSSRFDDPRAHKPFVVTISDASLFRAGGRLQTGFRRAGLLLRDDINEPGADAADTGIVTFHWSVRQDASKPLNLTHEYMNVWHERADYAGNQWTFSMGLLLPVDGGDGIDTREKRESFKVHDNKNKIVFSIPINWDEWQNFAIQLNYDKSTMQVFYSEGYAELKAVTEPLANDNSGGGQMQLGMAKKPTETETVVWDGYHESIVGKEGQVYGGVFVEDSTDECISV